jgi:hypothetical protein
MLVRFVEAFTGRPVGMAWRVCTNHLSRQRVPEHRELEILDEADTGECEECQHEKFKPKGIAW